MCTLRRTRNSSTSKTRFPRIGPNLPHQTSYTPWLWALYAAAHNGSIKIAEYIVERASHTWNLHGDNTKEQLYTEYVEVRRSLDINGYVEFRQEQRALIEPRIQVVDLAIRRLHVDFVRWFVGRYVEVMQLPLAVNEAAIMEVEKGVGIELMMGLFKEEFGKGRIRVVKRSFATETEVEALEHSKPDLVKDR